MPQKQTNADENQTLVIRGFLFCFLLVLMANIVFAWYTKPFDISAWLATLGPALTAVIYAYYTRTEENKKLTQTQEEILNHKLNILLVEDLEIYAVKIRYGLNRRDYPAFLAVTASCETAWSMLKQNSPYEFQDRPDVLLLDLCFSHTQMQGFDLLKLIRNDSNLFDLPVIILTGAKDSMIVNANAETEELIKSCCAMIEKHKGIDAIIEAIESCNCDQRTKIEQAQTQKMRRMH